MSQPRCHAHPATLQNQRSLVLPKSQRGETLVGLLVGMGMGVLVLAAGSQMLAQHLRGHRDALHDSHMHHDLRAALDTIGRELRQAQFVAHAWQVRSSEKCQDPFCAGLGHLTVQGPSIRFARDRNQDGMLDNNECVGFRLKDHELQMRTACSPEVWTDLTDAGSLKMTDLQFRVRCEVQGPWVARWVTVQLAAQWPRDARKALQLTHTLKLRNDVPALPWPSACEAAS